VAKALDALGLGTNSEYRPGYRDREGNEMPARHDIPDKHEHHENSEQPDAQEPKEQTVETSAMKKQESVDRVASDTGLSKKDVGTQS
jgi:hypothetical protein